MMKKMLILAFVAVSMLVVSCGKDKDKEEKSKEIGIVGTWYEESSVVNGEATTLDDCEKKTHIIFTDKTSTRVVYRKNQQGECEEIRKEEATYTISGNQLTLKTESGETRTSTFLISGNTLTLTNKRTIDGKEQISVYILKKR